MIAYRCSSCGAEFESDEIVYRCPKCSAASIQSSQETDGHSAASEQGFQIGNLIVDIDVPALKKGLKRGGSIDPFLLLPSEYPVAQCHRYFPAGNTPVSALRVEAAGLKHVYAKWENLNPSGSLKDRASLLVAAQAIYHGQEKIVLASTGNAGSAMSAAAAALGLEVVLFVPASAPKEKLAQSLFYGATVIPVDGSYDQAFALSIEFSKENGGINRNTAYNPMTLEGKKTAAIEIYNQFPGGLPDIIYVPVGDGVIYAGLCKGFADLQALGLIDRLPRCVAVQANGSNAISQSFIQGREIALASASTLADSISVASPACGTLALQYLRQCAGWTVELDDREILSAQGGLARSGGLFAEPSSAITWAAAKKDLAQGRICGDESILLLVTGSGFKDMSSVSSQIAVPTKIEPQLEAVMNHLTGK